MNNNESSRTRKKPIEISTFRGRSIRNFFISAMTGASIGLLGANIATEKSKDLAEVVISRMNLGTPEEREKMRQELAAKEIKIEEEIKKKGKWRERLARLRAANGKGKFFDEMVPVIKFKKNFYDGFKEVEDIVYWSAFCSWWFAFFTFISGLLYRYLQSMMLKRELVTQHEEIVKMDVAIEEVKKLYMIVHANMEKMDGILKKIESTGTVDKETIEELKEVKDDFEEMEDVLEEDGLFRFDQDAPVTPEIEKILADIRKLSK